MGVRHRIYLVPGFFGFANLGELVYFGHARDFLVGELAARGVDAEVHCVLSHPTGSIRTRAADLLAVLKATAGDDGGPIHLIGHSTGGLDARLLVTPGADLGEGGAELESYVARVRAVVTLSSPHRGTPLASFFGGLFGAKLLSLLSLFTVYVLRFGRVPLKLMLPLAGQLVRMDRSLGWQDTILDQLFAQLLSDFSSERQRELSTFLGQVVADQSLIAQLTPQGMDLFNAGVPDRPGISYGSVVTRARPPSWRSRMATGLDPYAQATHAIYAFLHGRAAVPGLFPGVSDAHRLELARAYGGGMLPGASDGIVPTASQPWGKVLAAVWADHLDVIGHFEGPSHHPPHIDWLISASGFRRPAFEAVWGEVTRFLLDAPPQNLATERPVL